MLESSKFIGIEKAIPIRICDYILEDVKKERKQLGLIGSKTPQEIASLPKAEKDRYYNTLNKKRNSNVCFLDHPYIFRYILPLIKIANKNSWNIDFDSSEICQYTEYGKEQFYNWHQDTGVIPVNNEERKISCSLLLNDASEYDGGDLQFSWLDPETDKNEPQVKMDSNNARNLRSKGTLIVFPSNLIHRVTPITRGVRKSIVIWWKGKPFK